MPTNEQQPQDTYNETNLRALKRDEVRQIATQHNISNLRSLKKEQLIRAILNAQNQSLQNPQLPQQVEREDSDLKNLVLNERFDGKIQTYQYIPRQRIIERTY